MAEKTPTREERQERKMNLLKERGSRVFVVNTPVTHKVLDILQFTDRGLNRLRSRMGAPNGPSFAEGAEAIEKFNKLIDQLVEETKTICELADVKFRAPRGFEQEEK